MAQPPTHVLIPHGFDMLLQTYTHKQSSSISNSNFARDDGIALQRSPEEYVHQLTVYRCCTTKYDTRTNVYKEGRQDLVYLSFPRSSLGIFCYIIISNHQQFLYIFSFKLPNVLLAHQGHVLLFHIPIIDVRTEKKKSHKL